MRSELGKLMWVARIARPGAIYDASAAAQNFANFKPENCDAELLLLGMIKEMPMLIILNRVISNTFLHLNFAGNKPGSANNANPFRQRKKAGASKTHFAVANLIFKESNHESKREGKYQIKFPSMDWGEEDIEIEVRCDAGQILNKTGSRVS